MAYNTRFKNRQRSLINQLNLKINIENEDSSFPCETIIDFLLKCHKDFYKQAITQKFLTVKNKQIIFFYLKGRI